MIRHNYMITKECNETSEIPVASQETSVAKRAEYLKRVSGTKSNYRMQAKGGTEWNVVNYKRVMVGFNERVKREWILSKMEYYSKASSISKKIWDMELKRKKEMLSKYLIFPNIYLNFPNLSPFVNIFSIIANMNDRGLANIVRYCTISVSGGDVIFLLSFFIAGLLVAQMPQSLLEVEPTLVLDYDKLEILKKVILHHGCQELNLPNDVMNVASQQTSGTSHDICTCRDNPVHNRIAEEFKDKGS